MAQLLLIVKILPTGTEVDLDKLVELKNKCRELYNFGKHSLHMSDYSEDTFRIASSLLNQNSIDFLNNGTNNLSEQTKNTLEN